MGIETAILASLATSGGTAAAATAAGSVIGPVTAAASGLGTLSGIGGTLASGLSALSGLSSIFGGIQGLGAGNQQADFAAQQAALQADEIRRTNEREARFEQEQIDETVRRQKLAYLASGVTLEGSPLLVMENTRIRGQENINEIIAGGEASANRTLSEGRIRANQLKATGRSSFISGLTSGFGSLSKLV